VSLSEALAEATYIRYRSVDESPILRILAGSRFPPLAGHVVIKPAAAARPELELLALFGWHLMLLAGDAMALNMGNGIASCTNEI
jgi:hypothetical protein